MQHIGITGGIGSGKTTICNVFAQLGIPIYNADTRAKFLVKHSLQQEISKEFGADIFKNGQLNKELLAQRAFMSKEQTDKLNAIVHPAVEEDYKKWQLEQDAFYTLKEAALLIESGSYQKLDALILVLAPLEVRIKRTKKRDNSSREQVLSRINKQLSDEEKLPYATYTINNSGKESIIKQILSIHQQILDSEG